MACLRSFDCRPMSPKTRTDPKKLLRRIAELESALEASAARYKRLCALAPVGILRTDARCQCHYVNDRWREITGLTDQEAQGDGWAKALHPEDRDRVVAA